MINEILDYADYHPVKAGVLALAIVGTAWVGSCSVLNGVEYGEGTRVGVINKLSKKGILFKTYEGQMALEGITSSGGQTGANVWDFSVDARDSRADQLVRDIKENMNSGRKVQLDYTQKWLSFPTRGSTDSYVKDVRPMAPVVQGKSR